MSTVKLVNESALGIYVTSWTGAGHRRNVISWYEGLPGPVLEFFVSGRGRMSPPVPIRNPERFGWAGEARTAKARMADFRAFCQRFADEAERVTADEEA